MSKKSIFSENALCKDAWAKDAWVDISSNVRFVAKVLPNGSTDGKNDDDYYLLTDEEKKLILTDRTYTRSKMDGESNYTPAKALTNNRNEVEVMAAVDLYSTLEGKFGRKHPNDQVRNGALEQEILKLIQAFYDREGFNKKDFSEFKFEAQIV